MSTRTIPLLIAALLVSAGIAASAPASASARSTFCSPTGDLCYGVKTRSPVRLQITLIADFFKRYELCVTGPDGVRDCHRFRMQSAPHGLRQSTVRWSQHFPNRGHGTYRARWRTGGNPLGPPVTFRRT